MVKEYTMLSGQSLFDLAIQLYGDITQVFRLVADNPELDNIPSGFPGLVIQYEEQSTSLTEHYKNNTICCYDYTIHIFQKIIKFFI